MSDKYLILGCSGQLGAHFCDTFDRRGIAYLAHNRGQTNIADTDQLVRTIREYRPATVINCAAYNAVDQAEDEPQEAFRINSEAVGKLAEVCRDEGIVLVHYSSDYVFDGRKEGFYIESDEPNPLSQYGRSKWEGEKAVIASGAEYLLFRLSWVIGAGKQNFLYKLSQWAARKDVLKISGDETSVPTFTDDIVNVTLQSLEKGLRGLYHLTSGGYASRYELARYFIRRAGLKNLVIAAPVSVFNTKATRPLFSAMSNAKISEDLNITIPHWEEGVKRYVDLLNE